MKLLIIGQSVEDHINESGLISLKPGGIFYSASALVNLADEDDTIYLCTSMEKEKEYLFEQVYAGLDHSFFNYGSAIPVVHLTIHKDKERDELYENMNSSLKINADKLNDFDAVYLNMVTGFDITIDQLEVIRRKFNKLIYLDIHTLSRGLDSAGKRIFRQIPEAGRWLRSADIIQVNGSELFTLSHKKDEYEIISDVLGGGPKFLVVTMGEKGARLYFKENNEVISVYISAIKINTLNSVGCGDVFGAVYFYYYVQNNNYFEALKRANLAAGLTASYSSITEFSKLKYDVLSRYY